MQLFKHAKHWKAALFGEIAPHHEPPIIKSCAIFTVKQQEHLIATVLKQSYWIGKSYWFVSFCVKKIYNSSLTTKESLSKTVYEQIYY